MQRPRGRQSAFGRSVEGGVHGEGSLEKDEVMRAEVWGLQRKKAVVGMGQLGTAVASSASPLGVPSALVREVLPDTLRLKGSKHSLTT